MEENDTPGIFDHTNISNGEDILQRPEILYTPEEKERMLYYDRFYNTKSDEETVIKEADMYQTIAAFVPKVLGLNKTYDAEIQDKATELANNYLNGKITLRQIANTIWPFD